MSVADKSQIMGIAVRFSTRFDGLAAISNGTCSPYLLCNYITTVGTEFAPRMRSWFTKNLMTSFASAHNRISVNSTMYFFVITVVLWGIPSKIGNQIIFWVAIIMAALKSSRAWFIKCLNNNAVYRLWMTFTIKYQVNLKMMPILILRINYMRMVGKFATLAPDFKRPHSSMITDFIPRASRNRFPLFYIWIKLIISHCEYLLSRYAFWLEPDRCLQHHSGLFNYIANTVNCKEYIYYKTWRGSNNPLAPQVWTG